MEEKRIQNAIAAFATELRVQNKKSVTAGGINNFFYEKFPLFHGTINKANIENYGKSAGISYSYKDNSFRLNSTNRKVNHTEIENSEYNGLIRLREWMQKKRLQSMNVSKIAEFYNDGNEDCNGKMKIKDIPVMGHKVGLRFKNYEVSIISPVAVPFSSTYANAYEESDNARTISDSEYYDESIEDSEYHDGSIEDSAHVQENENVHIVVPKRYLRFDTDSGEPIYRDRSFSTDEIDINDAEEENHDDQTKLIDLLPESIQQALEPFQSDSIRLNELIIDLGRPPEVYYSNIEDFTAKERYCFEDMRVSREDLDHILNQLNALEVDFSSDNRCGLPLTLHRISRKLNRTDKTIGLSMRFGQMVQGSTRMITDLVKQRKSILVIGVPGVGKTTLLRELARVLSEEGVKVEIVDTSNEIAGEGDEMHPSIGRARRMMVPDRRKQHDVMVEAVQNHAPECIIIDEIGTQKEARAAADITQRGVQIIGTAHGTSLQQIIDNSELNRLIGDVHTVILGDAEAKARKATSKSVSERKGPCAFDAAIELTHIHSWVIYPDLTKAVDCMLQKKPLVLLKRTLEPQTKQLIEEEVEMRFD